MLSEAEFDDQLRQRLKDLRKREGWTQDKVARDLDITTPAYQKYETKHALPAFLIPRICTLYNVPVWFLLTGTFAGEPASQVTSFRSKR